MLLKSVKQLKQTIKARRIHIKIMQKYKKNTEIPQKIERESVWNE